MKFAFGKWLAAAVLMLGIPASARLISENPVENAAEQSSENVEPTAVYKILRTKSGEIEEIPVTAYLIGAVAAEMPASYDIEALKAQTVASHTYAERIRIMHQTSPDPALCGADLSDDPAAYQAFYSQDELRTMWGSEYARNYEKITDAVNAVGDLVLYYDDEPIIAAFHAVSSGRTASSEAVWGTALPYLLSVESPQDEASPHFSSEKRFSADEAAKILSEIAPKIMLPSDPAAWFLVSKADESGVVMTVQCGDTVLTGQQIRAAFGLKSACFTVDFDGAELRFSVRGYGHAVGMSQFGAQQMALAGSGFGDILRHYYQGAVLRTVDCSTWNITGENA